jgi:succinate-acetate transporter protein
MNSNNFLTQDSALAVFALTNTLMSLFLMHVRGVKEMNFLIGVFWCTAGITNIICAIFELLIGNTFAWTIFGSLGGYFMSMGVLLTPGFGVSEHYGKTGPLGPKGGIEFKNAMGLFSCCWAAMFLLFLIVAIRTNIFMVLIFACVSVTCLLMGISDFCVASRNPVTADVLSKVSLCRHVLFVWP